MQEFKKHQYGFDEIYWFTSMKKPAGDERPHISFVYAVGNWMFNTDGKRMYIIHNDYSLHGWYRIVKRTKSLIILGEEFASVPETEWPKYPPHKALFNRNPPVLEYEAVYLPLVSIADILRGTEAYYNIDYLQEILAAPGDPLRVRYHSDKEPLFIFNKKCKAFLMPYYKV